MGKKSWHSGKGGHKPQGQQDISSCRGFGTFLATCFSARERETSNELVNLITEVVEEIYPAAAEEAEAAIEEKELSIEELVRREVEAVKDTKNKRSAQKAISINTGVKGVVLVRLTQRNHDPVRIYRFILDKIMRDKLPLTRHVVRLIPLQITFFPNDDEFREHVGIFCGLHLPPRGDPEDLPSEKRRKVEGGEGESNSTVGDSTSPSASASTEVPLHTTGNVQKKPSVPYCIEFKARNHTVLTKDIVFQMLNFALRDFGHVNYLKPELIVHVEALKNIGGMSWIENPDQFHNFNIRRVQESLVPSAAEVPNSSISENAGGEDKEVADEGEPDVDGI